MLKSKYTGIAIVLILLGFLLVLLRPKTETITYQDIHISIRAGYTAQVYGNSLTIQKSTLNQNKLAPFIALCALGQLKQHSINEFLQSFEAESRLGTVPKTPGPPKRKVTYVKYFGITDWVELETPYIPLCSNVYSTIRKPDDIFLPHTAYLFMLRGKAYEVIFFSGHLESRVSDVISRINN